MARFVVLFVGLVALANVQHLVAEDPSSLQDFCVATSVDGVMEISARVWLKPRYETDLGIGFLGIVAVSVNGAPCKDPKMVNAADFFFSGLNKMGNTSNMFGSNVTRVTVTQIPGLNTLGISMARVDFAPFGLTPLHTHPRGTEILYLMKGMLQVGFITSNPNNTFISKVLQKGDVFVFPVGLIHFQRNIGNTNATAILAFSSQNPGLISIPNTVFGSKPSIPSEVLAKAFQTQTPVIDQVKSKFA